MRHIVLLLLLAWAIQASDASGELPPVEKEWPLGSNESRELLAIRPGSGGREEVLYSESYALLIGEYDYSNGFSKFEHVNDEMLRIGSALRSHNFHVFYYANLSGDMLRRVIGDFAQTYGQTRQARIVIYLSGHGETLEDVLDDSDPPRKKDVGFFVPVDAPKVTTSEGEFRKKALRLSEIVEWTDAMTALHVLVVLDSCFSGAILQNFKGGRPLKEKSELPPLDSVFKKPYRNRARLFISAGSAKEPTPNPSNLAIYFTDALEGRRQDKLADRNGDGYLTGEEFYALISAYLPGEPPGTTPRMGYSSIASGWENGNIAFKLRSEAAATADSTSTAVSTSKSAPVVAPSSPNFIEDYYTSASSCDGCDEGAGTETPIKLEMPTERSGTLTNAILECRGSSCQFSAVVRGPELSSDAKSVTATVKTWGGRKATWYMRADVQAKSTYVPSTVETDLTKQSSVTLSSTPLPRFVNWDFPSSLNSTDVFNLPLRPRPNYFLWTKEPFDVWPSFPESTTTTTTSTDGTVTTFVPGKTIVIRRVGVTDPVSYVFGKTVRFVSKTGAEIQASKIKPGTRVHVYYDGTGDNRVVSRVVVDPLVTLDIKTFTLHSDSDSFDLRTRLEANEDKARYSARETLSKMLAKMSPEEIGTLIGAMPNSSYRYVLGISEALAKCSGGWYAPNLEESFRIMDRIAAQQGDKALSESIRRAKKNAKPNAGVNS